MIQHWGQRVLLQQDAFLTVFLFKLAFFHPLHLVKQHTRRDLEQFHSLQAAKDLVKVVQATGQRYAMTHIIDVFRGANTRSVRQHKHDSITEHGIGKEFT